MPRESKLLSNKNYGEHTIELKKLCKTRNWGSMHTEFACGFSGFWQTENRQMVVTQQAENRKMLVLRPF